MPSPMGAPDHCVDKAARATAKAFPAGRPDRRCLAGDSIRLRGDRSRARAYWYCKAPATSLRSKFIARNRFPRYLAFLVTPRSNHNIARGNVGATKQPYLYGITRLAQIQRPVENQPTL